MAYFINHDEAEGIIEIKFDGVFDLSTAQAAMRDSVACAVEKQCYHMLSDLLTAAMTLKVFEIFMLPVYLEKIAAQAGLNAHQVHHALLAEPGKNISFYENTFYNRGYMVMAFTDPAAAKTWLRDGK